MIIVLGGGSHERPLRAAELFRQKAAPRIIVTGAGDDEINRQHLIQTECRPRHPSRRQIQDNARERGFTIKLLRAEKIHSAILVTSWYHSRRAEKTFEHFAPDIQFYSRPSYFAFARADWKKPGVNKRMRLEFLKLPGYWIRYGVNPF